MFDDIDHQPTRVIGSVELELHEDIIGDWHVRVTTPRTRTSDVRKIYKMALITADTQVHVNSRLPLIDRMILNNKEIAEYQAVYESEQRDKPVAAVEQYQTKLPFTGSQYKQLNGLDRGK